MWFEHNHNYNLVYASCTYPSQTIDHPCHLPAQPVFGDVTYQLHFDDNGDGSGGCVGAPLLAARKRKKSKASSFLIGTDVHNLTRSSAACVAKV